MNVWHWVIISIYGLSFIMTLYKHGEPKDEVTHNAVSTFWVCVIVIALVVLSAKNP